MKTQFKVSGMTCKACKALIEDVASDFPEIGKCEVDFSTGLGEIEYADGFDREKFKAGVHDLGTYKLEFTS